MVGSDATQRGEEERDGFLLLHNAHHERRVALVVARVQQRAASDERLHHLHVVLVDRAEDGRFAQLIGTLQVL